MAIQLTINHKFFRIDDHIDRLNSSAKEINMDVSFSSNELSTLIHLLNNQSFISICMIKDQIKQGVDLSFTETLDLEGVNQNQRFVHSDAAEGMAAFMEKRKPIFNQ